MKEYTLFEMEEPVKEYIILHEPSKAEMTRWEDLLNVNYTVPELQELAQPLLKFITRTPVQILTSNAELKEPSSILVILQKKGNKPKADWLQLAAFFLAEPLNLKHYVTTFSEEEVCVWKLIIKKLYANNQTLEAATGKKWITKTSSWGYRYDFTPCQEAGWFTVTKSASDKIDRYGYREKDAYLFLHPAFRKLFAPIFFPEVSYSLKFHEELPAQGLFTFNGEADFIRCYPILQALYKQGILTMGKNKMLATTIKKASKQSCMKEFFEGNVPKELNGIRANIILPAVTMLFDYTKRQKDKKAEDLLKELKSYFHIYYPDIVSVLLPDINGIKSSKLIESTIGALIMDAIFALTNTPQGWISISDIVNKLLIHPIGQNSLQVFKPYQLEGMDLFNKTTGEYVHLGNLTEHLGIPFLKGLYFLMGGLGMLELAYEYPSQVSSSAFNSLKYIRLTELGKYALGMVQTYTPPAQEKKKLFHLDSERLLIRSLEPGNPYESMLQDTAIPIGGYRFIMNSDSFLKNCKTEKDVTDKIDFFKQFISQEKAPEVWTSFFDSLLKQCHPLKKIKSDNYVIYQLDGNNKELICLLTTDSVLKSIIIRAEGYMILVDVKNQKKLIDRLKTYGYLL